MDAGADPPDEPAAPPAQGEPTKRFNAFEHFHAGRAQPRRVRTVLAVGASAIRITRASSPTLFWFVMAGQLLTAALLGLQVLTGKLALQAVIEQANAAQGSIRSAVLPLVGLALTTALAGLVGSAQVQLQRALGERVQQATWRQILGVTTRVRLADFESPTFFDDLERVKVNAVVRPLTMATGLVEVAGGLLSVLGLAVTIAVIAPLLLPILLVGGLPLWLLSRRTGRIEFRFLMRLTPVLRKRHYYQQVLTERDEAKEVRAFDLGEPLTRRWQEKNEVYLHALDAHVRTRVLLGTLSALVTAVASSLALGCLIYLVVDDQLSLASAGAAVIAVRLFAGRFQQLFGGVSQLVESSLFLQDLERFLARAPVEDAPDARVAVPPLGADFDLRLEDVGFRYPGSHRDALADVSIRIRRGEVIALVGANGSGKTTLAKLIAQLYDPSSGRVLWNGTDVRVLDRRALRSRIGVIFQDFVRYELSARDNVGMARFEDIEDFERIRAAARWGGIDEHLSQLPDGYETGLGKEFMGGYDLSGGQWQRVALARAFFRDAELLVLDEPTAALDAQGEHEVFEYVRELAVGRSLVLISHRFSTVRSADRIYVLEQGALVEEGSHDELMALGGRYARMFSLQAEAYR